MSKLEELIQQYCPDGVEYYKIKDVYKRIKGTPITAGKMKEIATPNGCVRIFAGGKTVIDANEKDIPNANVTRVPAVLVQSRGVIDAVYYDKPFTFKSEMWAYTTFNQKSVKYLYYILKSNIQTFRDAASGMGSLPQISLCVTEEFEIPVPPLPVQEEIVRILDNFTELQAELQKRKQQYNYYLDNLLSFKNINRGGQAEVRWMKMSDIAKLSRGHVISKDYLQNNAGIYPVYSSQTANNGELGQINTYDYNGNYLTWTTDGAYAGTIFKRKGCFSITNVCGLIALTSELVNLDYLYYWLKITAPSYVYKGMGNPKLMSNVMESILIPIIPLSEQQRIVSILDRFDRLTTDLTQGLPAEIEKTAEQYEYYRDKLLTFKRKEA